MTIKQLMDILSKYPKNKKVLVACDEEWNTIYSDLDIQVDTETNGLVISGLSGSEI